MGNVLDATRIVTGGSDTDLTGMNHVTTTSGDSRQPGHFASATIGGLLCFAMVGTMGNSGTYLTNDQAYVSYMRHGTGPAVELSTGVALPIAAPEFDDNAATASTITDADTVKWLHGASGLTWDQLGKIFGVSRRAVHLWANGGRLNAANAAKLAEFVALVRELPACESADRRTRLLAAGKDGRSILDKLRERNHSADITGSQWSPAQLLGAELDRPSSQT